MNTVALFDCAKCRCGYSIPIRPSKIPLPSSSREPLETDDEPLVVACSECKRVFEAHQLKPEQTLWGLAPFYPEAPMRVFQVPIRCDELNCEARVLVHVMLKSNTTDEELRKEIASWLCMEGVTCEAGHPQPLLPWR